MHGRSQEKKTREKHLEVFTTYTWAWYKIMYLLATRNSTFAQFLHHVFNWTLVDKFQCWLCAFLQQVVEKRLQWSRQQAHGVVCSKKEWIVVNNDSQTRCTPLQLNLSKTTPLGRNNGHYGEVTTVSIGIKWILVNSGDKKILTIVERKLLAEVWLYNIWHEY